MPFGLPDELDTPENQRKMERCVKRVQNQEDVESKEQAVRICKASIIQGARK